MSTLNEDLATIQTIEDGLVENQVARFAYTETAYEDNDVDGVDSYDADAEQNIPNGTASVMKVNETVIEKGFRSQASSITRMLINHFFGRVSYNLNKLNDNFSSLVTTLTSHLGTANGFASLDSDGRIPYSQLPESAIEFKGTWNASTNVWTGTDSTTGSLVDGTGTIGDMYVVTTAGWFDSSTGTGSSTEVSGYTEYLVNDRILYNGSTWMKLSSGSVKSVNGIYPESGEVTLYGSDIEMNSSDSSTLDDMINSKQSNVIEITQEEYDALSDSDKEGNLYVITDADTNDNSLIDDSVRATDSTWSSDRIAPSIQVFTAGTTTITGGTLYTGAVIRVMFTSAITGSNTTTALSLTYNDTAYSVKVGKQGSLSNFVASYVNSTYTYLQAYTTLELAFDGTQFIIIGNPVVLSSSDYTIYADGSSNYDFKTSGILYLLDGSSYTINSTEAVSITRTSLSFTLDLDKKVMISATGLIKCTSISTTSAQFKLGLIIDGEDFYQLSSNAIYMDFYSLGSQEIELSAGTHSVQIGACVSYATKTVVLELYSYNSINLSIQ